MSPDEAAFALSLALTFGLLGAYALHLWAAGRRAAARTR